MTAFPPEVRRFADMFAALQKVRQQVDYAPDGKYEKEDVQAAIDIAEDTSAGFEQAAARHRRAFVAHGLFKGNYIQEDPVPVATPLLHGSTGSPTGLGDRSQGTISSGTSPPLSSLSLRCVELVETSKRTPLLPRPLHPHPVL